MTLQRFSYDGESERQALINEHASESLQLYEDNYAAFDADTGTYVPLPVRGTLVFRDLLAPLEVGINPQLGDYSYAPFASAAERDAIREQEWPAKMVVETRPDEIYNEATREWTRLGQRGTLVFGSPKPSPERPARTKRDDLRDAGKSRDLTPDEVQEALKILLGVPVERQP